MYRPGLATCLLLGATIACSASGTRPAVVPPLVLDGVKLVDAEGIAVASLPFAWIDSMKRAEDDYVDTVELLREVGSFAIDDRYVGIHVTAWGSQQDGTARAASGADLFAVYDVPERRLAATPLVRAPSKSRQRAAGCWSASNEHYYVDDVNGDGANDLGILTESVRCEWQYDPAEEMDRPVSVRHVGDLQWLVFEDDETWHRNEESDNACTDKLALLPRPGLEVGPVEYVAQFVTLPEIQTTATSDCHARAVSLIRHSGIRRAQDRIRETGRQ